MGAAVCPSPTGKGKVASVVVPAASDCVDVDADVDTRLGAVADEVGSDVMKGACVGRDVINDAGTVGAATVNVAIVVERRVVLVSAWV